MDPQAEPHRQPARQRDGWRAVMAVAAAVTALSALAAIGLAPPVRSWLGGDRDRVAAAPGATAVTPTPAAARHSAAPVATPSPGRRSAVQVEVPAIGVAAKLDRLVLDRSGVLQTPVTAARPGWYATGAVPGETGPAVIAGHVDSKSGPGVFFRLRQLKAGALVVVRLSSGAPARFRITAVHTYPKDKFPTSEVYGPTPGPELRLITCGGNYDRRAASYRDNVVAFAVPE